MLITLDVSVLDALAEKLTSLDAKALQSARKNAVNIVSLAVRKKAVDNAATELNLPRAYIESRLNRDQAQGTGRVRAYITSPIRGATLQRFGAAQATKSVNWSNAKIASMGVQVGKWPHWTPRTGDAARGIAPDKKAHGVSVDVNKKGAKRITSAFTIPLKNGNGRGVFRRENGKVEHLYGPSVYQTFRRYIGEQEQSISEMLATEFGEQIDKAIQGALA